MNEQEKTQAELKASFGIHSRNEYMAMTPQRQGARTLLRQRIQQLHREVRQLEALEKALPLELPEQADDALFNLLTK